jgi:hypothetical protein
VEQLYAAEQPCAVDYHLGELHQQCHTYRPHGMHDGMQCCTGSASFTITCVGHSTVY